MCQNFVVEISKSPHVQLGLGISSVRYNDGSMGIAVTDVLPTSPIAGRIQLSDHLMTVNGYSLKNRPYHDALQLLRNAGQIVKIGVHRCQPGISESMNSLNTRESAFTVCDLRNEPGGPPPLMPPTPSESELKELRTVRLDRRQHDERCIQLTTQAGCGDGIDVAVFVLQLCMSSQLTVNIRRLDTHQLTYFRIYSVSVADHGEALYLYPSLALGVELASRITIRSVAEGELGEQSGLRGGDRILSLNGINAAHLSLVDTANMLRRQETLLQVARPKEDTIRGSQMNIGEPAPRRFEVSPRQRRMLQRRSRLKDHGSESDVRFSSLRDVKRLSHSSMDPIRQHTQSLQDFPLDPQISRSTSHSTHCLHHNPNPLCSKHARQLSSRNRSDAHLHRPNNHHSPCRHSHRSEEQLDYLDSALLDSGIANSNLYHSTSSSLISSASSPSSETGSTSTLINRLARSKTRGVQEVHQGLDGLSNKSRVVRLTLPTHRSESTGLTLVGGNVSGVFIGQVHPGSIAALAGLKRGDKIMEIDDLPVDQWTKEEVALALISNPGATTGYSLHLRLDNEDEAFRLMHQSETPHDRLTLRAYFNLPKLDGSPSEELKIAEGDILQVTDTLPGGVFGSWRAYKVHPTPSALGLIPNLQRAESHLSTGVAYTTFCGPGPYDHLVPLTAFPSHRPVVLFGPLATLARQRLASIGTTLAPPESGISGFTSSLRFGVPPISATVTGSTPVNAGSTGGLIRLSAIQVWVSEEAQMTEQILALATKDELVPDTDPNHGDHSPISRADPQERDATFELNDPKLQQSWNQKQEQRLPNRRKLTSAQSGKSGISRHTSPRSDSHFNRSPDNMADLARLNYMRTLGETTSPRSVEMHRRANSLNHEMSGIHPDSWDTVNEARFMHSPRVNPEGTVLSNWDSTVSSLNIQHDGLGQSMMEFNMFGVYVHSSTPGETEERACQIENGDNNQSAAGTETHDPGYASQVPIESTLSENSQIHLSPSSDQFGGASRFGPSESISAKRVLAECAGEFGNEGGTLELPDHGVCLRMPRGSLPINCERQRIFLRVYASDQTSGATGGRLISPLVMCGPHGLRFRRPVQLTLPRYSLDNNSDDQSDQSDVAVLHASANGTSTDEEAYAMGKSKLGNRRPSWHIVPLVRRTDTVESNKLNPDRANTNTDGIFSQVEHGRISVWIDHF